MYSRSLKLFNLAELKLYTHWIAIPHLPLTSAPGNHHLTVCFYGILASKKRKKKEIVPNMTIRMSLEDIILREIKLYDSIYMRYLKIVRLIEKEYALFLHFTFTGLVCVCVGEDSRESLGWHGSNKSILKEINPEYSLEGLMLKLNLWCFGHLDAKSWLIGKDADAGKDWGQEEKGTTEDEIVGWHHWLNDEFEQILTDSEGQESLAHCSPLDHKELDMT